jgi:hypothetical protein
MVVERVVCIPVKPAHKTVSDPLSISGKCLGSGISQSTDRVICIPVREHSKTTSDPLELCGESLGGGVSQSTSSSVCISVRKPSIPVHDPLNNGSCVTFGFDNLVPEIPEVPDDILYVVHEGITVVFNGVPVVLTKTMKGE